MEGLKKLRAEWPWFDELLKYSERMGSEMHTEAAEKRAQEFIDGLNR